MPVTLDDVTKLKTEAERINNQRIKAESTVIEIDKQIQGVNQEIIDIGFDPEKAASQLADLEKEIEEEYQNIKASMPRL